MNSRDTIRITDLPEDVQEQIMESIASPTRSGALARIGEPTPSRRGTLAVTKSLVREADDYTGTRRPATRVATRLNFDEVEEADQGVVARRTRPASPTLRTRALSPKPLSPKPLSPKAVARSHAEEEMHEHHGLLKHHLKEDIKVVIEHEIHFVKDKVMEFASTGRWAEGVDYFKNKLIGLAMLIKFWVKKGEENHLTHDQSDLDRDKFIYYILTKVEDPEIAVALLTSYAHRIILIVSQAHQQEFGIGHAKDNVLHWLTQHHHHGLSEGDVKLIKQELGIPHMTSAGAPSNIAVASPVYKTMTYYKDNMSHHRGDSMNYPSNYANYPVDNVNYHTNYRGDNMNYNYPNNMAYHTNYRGNYDYQPEAGALDKIGTTAYNATQGLVNSVDELGTRIGSALNLGTTYKTM